MKIPFQQLLSFSKRAEFSEAIAARTWNAADNPYSDTRGFHAYADLDLIMQLAAGDDQGAYQNLRILQAFASAAEAVGDASDLRILEVQGQRLHLFMESETPDAQTQRELLQGCRTFYHLAKQEIGKLAGETPFQIRMAADYGRAILLRSTGDDVSESIVSLGNPANRPAKKLAREVKTGGVPAGCLAFNTTAVKPNGESLAPEWAIYDLDGPLPIDEAREETVRFSTANSAYGGLSPAVMAKLAREFEPNPYNPVTTPLRRRGFMVRADLDQFSPRVKLAMESGEDGIKALVATFQQIMHYPIAFKDGMPDGVTVLMFPWAGDCANFFLECDDYVLERSYLPSKVGMDWHTQNGASGVDWHKVLGDCKWLVAIAGGDPGEEHGMVLTGNVYAGGRTFHVGAGWSWRRSLDAEQSKGTAAEDTVIQVEDYRGLDSGYQSAYREHPDNPTLFRIASLSALKRSQQRQVSAAKVSIPAIVPAVNVQVAAPRPYSA